MKQFPFWWLVVALIVAVVSVPARAHDVKDPVCRMAVDSDTAKFHYKLGNKTFYFCSKECQAKFTTAPEKYSKLAGQLEKNDLHDYRVDFKTDGEPTAGRPVKLENAIRYADSGSLIKEFEVVHERLLHLVMTSEDMSWFEHQHPVRGKDGIFRLTWSFPHAGNYRLYADFTPADGDNQIKPILLAVGGPTTSAVPLRPDRRLVKQIGDLRFHLTVRPGTPLSREKPALLTYTVRDRRGRAVTDMQPYIGAMGHLLAISRDGKDVVHTHVLQTPSQSSEPGRPRVTAAMISAKGPVFSFLLTPPSAGLYKTWAQFMHHNRVYTVPVTFQGDEIWKTGAQ